MHDHDEHSEERRLSTRWQIGLGGFLVIAAYFLWTEHRAHLVGALSFLPWLLLLACPLLHFFMHGSEGGHGGHNRGPGDRK